MGFELLAGDDALILVDVQNDFLPGGSLGVPDGHEVIPALNRAIEQFRLMGLPMFATRDWHPPNHCSFKSQGGKWPQHCVIGSNGAQFAADLRLPPEIGVVSKATRPDVEAYSGFEGTDLDERLKRASVVRVFVGGLATDYCVLNTVKDALKIGYRVCLIRDGVKAVNVMPEDGANAEAEMVLQGATRVQSTDIVASL